MTIPRWITTAKREGRFEENVRTLGEPDEAARGAVVNALFVEAIQDHPSDTVDKKILSTETLHIVEIEDE